MKRIIVICILISSEVKTEVFTNNVKLCLKSPPPDNTTAPKYGETTYKGSVLSV